MKCDCGCDEYTENWSQKVAGSREMEGHEPFMMTINWMYVDLEKVRLMRIE